ncbi:MAG: CcmD family protein [Thermodesulfobacteriota bacterium]
MEYLLWGHIITWLMIALYVVYLISVTKKLENQLKDINK